jgi:starch synthase
LKALNKSALQRRFKLPVAHEIPLIAFIGRLVDQKGVDMLFDALPTLLQHKVQLVMLGSGEHRFEKILLEHMEQFPEQVGGHIGYDESLAHSIEAGADIFVMPSRFEPCGLNQMYSMRYGTVPIVRRTGGLADSVIDATWDSMKTSTATGFVFDEATPQALLSAVRRALELFAHSTKWRILMKHVMMQDFSWQESARAYLDLYQRTRRTLPNRQAS